MLRDVAQHYGWVSIPLAVEIELGESNWFDKRPYEVAA
jgi:hypothetical protein